jgi:hypothetical protein
MNIFKTFAKLTLLQKIIIILITLFIIGLSIGLPLGLMQSKNSNNTKTSSPSSSTATNISPTENLCWMDNNASFENEYINKSGDQSALGSFAYSGEVFSTKKYKWAYDPNTLNYIVLDFNKLNKTYYSGNDLEGLKKTISGNVIYVANKLITIRNDNQTTVLTLKPCSEF